MAPGLKAQQHLCKYKTILTSNQIGRHHKTTIFYIQMSLAKVNEGFEGDKKSLVKEKSVRLEEGQGGDGGGHQVTRHNDCDHDVLLLVVVMH